MATSQTGMSYTNWKKANPNGTLSQWKSAPAPSKPAVAAQAPAPKLNFTQEYMKAQKSNPNLTTQEFEKTFTANNQGGAAYLEQAQTKNQALAKTNQEKAQAGYLASGGKLTGDQTYDPYAMLQKSSQTGGPVELTTGKEADLIRENISGVANYKTPISQQSNYGKAKNTYQKMSVPSAPQFTGEETPEQQLQMQLDYQTQLTKYEQNEKQGAFNELGTVSGQVSDFASQLQSQQQQVKDLMNSLNSKKPGLGDEVNSILDEMAKSGVQADLTPETFKMLEDMAMDTPMDQIDDKIAAMSAQPVQEPQAPVPQAMPEPMDIPVPKNQEYASLKQSGMNASQIVQQNPGLMSQVVPDGTIINPGTGVGLIQTPMGEAYKLPSGLIVPRDPSSGFYNLQALSPDDLKKLTYSDILSIDLSTQKTTSDLKAYYSAQTFGQMAKRNDREYEIASLQMDTFYNSENNRLNESQVKNMQGIEIEKMRQILSKDTSLKQLDEAKSKTANIMKAQMDAWGMEGSSAALVGLSAHSLKFEQEASAITQSYDINVMQLAMASTQTQMEFTNRITELNQNMQVQKVELSNEHLNRKDEIDKSVLLSNIEQITEKQNMYRDYAGKIYEAEQQAQAAAAAAEKEAQAEIWEKQKYYSEQMGMLVSVGQDGSINPLLSEDGVPIETMEGKKFSLEGRKFDLEIDKFGFDMDKFAIDTDYRERVFGHTQSMDAFDVDLRERQFQEDVAQFGMTYALDQQKQNYTEFSGDRGFELDVAKYDQADAQFYAGMKGFEMTVDENGDNIGTNKMGEVVNFGQGASVAVPTKSKYDYNVVSPNEIRFNVPPGKLKTRGECGQMVNDVLFGGGVQGAFADSFTDKMKLNNSPGTPVAGGAFVENIPDLWTGHVGLVEKVNPDGSFEIRESNYHGTWNVSTETIHPGSVRYKRIVEGGGFYDPVKGGTSTNKKGKGVTGDGAYAQFVQQQVKSGMGQKDAIALANKKMEEGSVPGMETADPQAIKKKEMLLKAIQSVKSSKGLGIGVGKSRFISEATTAGAEFNSNYENLRGLLTVENLKLMSGTLTDKDIEILEKAAMGGLSKTLSEEDFRAKLGELESSLFGSISPSKPKMPSLISGPGAMAKYLKEKKAYEASLKPSSSGQSAGSRSGYSFGTDTTSNNYSNLFD